MSCSSSSACTAVGEYYNPTKQYDLMLAEGWNGTEWKVQSTPQPSESEGNSLQAVSCSSSIACIAVGSYTPENGGGFHAFAERWNGTEWQVQSMPSPSEGEDSQLFGVSCSSPTACIAVGRYYNTTLLREQMLTESWNGSEWKLQSTAEPSGGEKSQLIGVSCSSSTACTAVGLYYDPTITKNAYQPLAERWNGTEWKAQTATNPTGAEGSELYAVSCASSTFCTAVGEYYNSGSEERKMLAESWNGTEWKTQSTPEPGGATEESRLTDVSCASSTSCTAVGQGADEALFADHWNGTEWGIQPTPVAEESAHNLRWEGVSCTSSRVCVTVGYDYNDSGVLSALADRKLLPPPSVSTEAATSVGQTTATLNGTVDPNGLETKYYFEYGTSMSYGSKTAEASAGSGESNVGGSKTVTGLRPGTTYHFRIIATNSTGTTDGGDYTFTTDPLPWHMMSTVGSRGSGDGSFEEVAGVAVDSEGHVWVADAGNDRVEEFSAGGEYMRAIKTEAYPYGIAIDSKGDLWVTDSEADLVQEFSASGTLITQFGSPGGRDGELTYPMGIAIDSKGDVWVADADNERVEEFSATGAFIATVGTAGKGEGQFEFPTGLAFNAEGDLWVVDSNNSRIEEFSSGGHFIRAAGSWGEGDDQFESPRGIAINSEGLIFVSDIGDDRIEELSSTGAYITVFGAPGSGEGELSWPTGLATDSKGDVWAADFHNDRLEKWGQSHAPWQDELNIGSRGSGDGSFEEVAGVAVDSEGHVWVADAGNDRVEEFSAGGEYMRAIKTEAYPYGIAIDSKGDLWVTDSEADLVQEFSASGTLITQFGSPGGRDGELTYPMGIAIDSKGDVWVADADNERVEEFSATGAFIATVGTAGKGEGQFEFPTGLAFNAEGDLWVVDSNNSRIEEFSSGGHFIRAAGSWGEGDDQFESPRGIAINSEGLIFVSDIGDDRIEELSSTGAYITVFGAPGSGEGELSWPTGLATDSKGDVWAADFHNDRLEKWGEAA